MADFQTLDGYLGRMLGLGASDVFLGAGSPPAYRVSGSVVRSDDAAPDEAAMERFVRLCKGGVIDPAEALRYSNNPDEFRLNMEGMYTGTDSIDLGTENQRKE